MPRYADCQVRTWTLAIPGASSTRAALTIIGSIIMIPLDVLCECPRFAAQRIEPLIELIRIGVRCERATVGSFTEHQVVERSHTAVSIQQVLDSCEVRSRQPPSSFEDPSAPVSLGIAPQELGQVTEDSDESLRVRSHQRWKNSGTNQ